MADFNTKIIDEFRANDGRVETAGFGDRLVLLHHLGARSGTERVSPLVGVPTDDGWLIAASKGGAPEEPGWANNLRAHPEVTVETGAGEAAVSATELKGVERDAAYRRFVEASDGFAEYEKGITRKIAVFQLTRTASEE